MSSNGVSQDWSGFPPEVVSLICTSLSKPDIKNVRLVCRGWSTAAERELYSEINLKVCMDSFERLWNISKHEAYRNLVKHIRYDTRILKKPAVMYNFDDWFHGSSNSCHDPRHLGLGDGLGLSAPDRRQFVAQFTRTDLEEAFRAYCQALIKQEQVLDDNCRELTILNAAFEKFPNFRVLEVSNSNPMHEDFEAPGPVVLRPDSLTSEARKILQERVEWTGRAAPAVGFWSIYHAALMSNCAWTIEEIRGYALDIETFGQEYAFRLRWFDREQKELEALKSITLEFKYGFYGNGVLIDGTSDPEVMSLALFLSDSILLESLDLSFQMNMQYAIWKDRFHLWTIFDEKTQWKYLKCLSLRAVTVPEELLCCVLRNHTSSLRELELTDIRLNRDKNTPSVAVGPERWVQIIMFLHNSMSLSKVSFYGSLDTVDYKGWITIDKPPISHARRIGADEVVSEDCFRSRIERYITRQGICPFTLDPSGSGYIPWTFQGDESWTLDGRERTPDD